MSKGISPVCVIGAGASGLAAVKALVDRGLPVHCFEKGTGIGGNWRFGNDNGVSSAYESLHINTSKSRMAFSDFPMPEEFPHYPHHTQVLRYFEAYAERFGLVAHIRFSTTITSVEPCSGGFSVTFEAPDCQPTTRVYRSVIICNGHHWSPKLPTFPGSFDGWTRHSHSYETPSGLERKRVLVVGFGNSAVDIAVEISRVAARTFISTRRGAHVIPKFVFGRPIDTFTTPFGSRLPLRLQRIFFNLLLALSRGPLTNFGLPTPDHRLLEAHPTISSSLSEQVGHGRITIKPNITRLEGFDIHFVDGTRENIDAIIFATGYNLSFPFLDSSLLSLDQNRVELYLHAVSPSFPGLFFVGLLQPLGAIMPLAEAQSIWIADLLAGTSKLPSEEAMATAIAKARRKMEKRYVRSDRHTLQVDFYPYLARIRKEIVRGRTRAKRAWSLSPAKR